MPPDPSSQAGENQRLFPQSLEVGEGIRPGTQTCPSASWPAWPPLPGWPSPGPLWRCWSGACRTGRSLPGSAVRLLRRAAGPAPSWGAARLAGCTGEEAWRASSADTGTGGKPRCTPGGGPTKHVGREDKDLGSGSSSSHRTHSIPKQEGTEDKERDLEENEGNAPLCRYKSWSLFGK